MAFLCIPLLLHLAHSLLVLCSPSFPLSLSSSLPSSSVIINNPQIYHRYLHEDNPNTTFLDFLCSLVLVSARLTKTFALSPRLFWKITYIICRVLMNVSAVSIVEMFLILLWNLKSSIKNVNY